MDGINQVTLVGSVGKDAETKLVGENNQVAKFSLATNRTYKDKTGAKVTETEWHNIETWQNLAKFVGNYIKAGDVVCVLGSIKNETYKKDDVTHYRTKIVANTVQIVKSKTPKSGETTTATATSSAAKQTEEYATANEVVGSQTFSSNEGDDLPF